MCAYDSTLAMHFPEWRNNIRVVFGFDERIVLLHQNRTDEIGIIFVHLAAVSFKEYFFCNILFIIVL